MNNNNSISTNSNNTEIDCMMLFSHANIVKLVAIIIEPLAIVTELMVYLIIILILLTIILILGCWKSFNSD